MTVNQDRSIHKVEPGEYSIRLRRARRSASAAVAGATLLCLLSSCGTGTTLPTQTNSPAATAASTSAASPTAAAPAAACADVAELKSSLEALTKVNPAEDGVAALKTAIENVTSNLEPALSSASEVLQPSLEQVKTAFAELQTAASGLTRDNFREKAPAIRTAMTQVRTATAELSSTLTESCSGQ